MTDDQLIDKLRTVIREEVEAETKKAEHDTLFSNVKIIKLVTDLKGSVKDLKISNSRLEKGQEEQGKILNDHSKSLANQGIMLINQGKIIQDVQIVQQSQGKALKALTTLAKKTYKSVNLMAGDFDEDIVNNDRRIDRIEDHLGLPPFKAKQ